MHQTSLNFATFRSQGTFFKNPEHTIRIAMPLHCDCQLMIMCWYHRDFSLHKGVEREVTGKKKWRRGEQKARRGQKKGEGRGRGERGRDGRGGRGRGGREEG